MTETNGDTWNNSCIGCATVKITHGLELPGQCPKCQGWRWLCHPVIPPNSQNDVKKDGTTTKTTIETVLAPIESPKQPKQPQCHPIKQGTGGELRGDRECLSGDNGQGNKSVAPRGATETRDSSIKVMPVAIILDLEGQGLGCKMIAKELHNRGLSELSYRTIARLLAKHRQGVLLQ